MLIPVNQIDSLRLQLQQWRAEGESVALVPTMGNLHAGHLALVNKAKAVADRVVVSIFVNPTQFGKGEDFETYPRTLESDCKALDELNVDMVFSPAAADMYPSQDQAESSTFVEVLGLSNILCGAVRPGHFRGVTTIVSKLFNLIQPDFAVFGEKDFQQLTIIRKMVADLNFPVEIIGQPTERESSGLAMSSRNGFLSQSEKQQAAFIFDCLQKARNALLTQTLSIDEIEREQIIRLESQGFNVDYFSIRNTGNLNPALDLDLEVVVMVAVRLGKTRLIDNLVLKKSS